MPTSKQIAASRANGALSKGPVSLQGKLNSSRNSLRHGLLARTVVLEDESTPRFLELLRALTDEFHPASATQLMLVETMAVARWRQIRTWGLQKVALDREIALQDPAVGPPEVRAALAFNKSSSTFDPGLLLRYEVSLDRQFNRALKQLLALQSNSSAQPSAPYFPESLTTQTWNDDLSPDPEGTTPPACARSLQTPIHHPQSDTPAGPDSDLAVLQASTGVNSRGLAIDSSSPAERTQQSLDSIHSAHPGPASIPPGSAFSPRSALDLSPHETIF